MICPDKERSTLNAEALPDPVRKLRQFSQAEAQLLGSVNYCFFPSPPAQPAQSPSNGDTQPESITRFTRVPR
jgi:hypothetical protein